MVKLVNRAKMATTTTGTGPITLGSVPDGFQSFAAAGVLDGESVRYVLVEGNAWEIGVGVCTNSGTTMSRTPSESSNAGSALNLAGSAEVFIAATAADVDGQIEATVVFSDTAPVAPANGDLWVDSTEMVLYCFYSDGDSAQWVGLSGAVGPQGEQGIQGIQGLQGPAGPVGNTSHATAMAIIFG